jgi:hypothetical protein
MKQFRGFTLRSSTVQHLSPDAAITYRQDGYLVARDLLDHRYIDTFVSDVMRILAEQLECQGLSPIGAASDLAACHQRLMLLHGHSQSTYLATLRVFNKLKSLYDLFLSAEIDRGCAALGVHVPLMHTLPLFHIMSHRLRLDDGYHGFEAHQDWSGLQTSLNAVVVWVPLHDTDSRRSPLEIVPKSHLNGLSRDTNSVGFISLEVAKGDVVFMTPFTVHRTGLSDTPQLRLAVSWRYEDGVEPTFVSRGFPFAQTRTVTHELLFPDFPDRRQMARVLTP